MSSSQLQEPNNTQRIRGRMQAQMQQQQQAVAAQQQTHQNIMSQSLHHLQNTQLGHQRWSYPDESQQGQQNSSFTVANVAALSLLELQGSGRNQLAGTGGAINVHPTLYMNTASLQQQRDNLGLGNVQQMQQPTGQIDQFRGTNEGQLQNVGLHSSTFAGSGTKPGRTSGNTSVQLMHKQKVIDDVRHQLHGRNGGGYVGNHTSSAGSTMPSRHDRSLLGSSLSWQQSQAQLQQPCNSIPNILGNTDDQTRGRALLPQTPQHIHISSQKMMNSSLAPPPGLYPEKPMSREDEDNAKERLPHKEESSINESSSTVIIPEYNDEQGIQTLLPSEGSSETNNNGSTASSSSVAEVPEILPHSTQEHNAGLKQGTRYKNSYHGQSDGSVKRVLQWEREKCPSLESKKAVGIVSASPLESRKKSAKRAIHLTNSPKYEPSVFLPHQLSADSSPGVPDHQLSVGSSADSRHSETTPRPHTGLRQSLSSTPQSNSKIVRRSTRESRPPSKLSPSKHAPTRRKKEKPPPLKLRVYGIETADNDDWSTYGRIARADDIKIAMEKRHTKVLEVEMSPFACWSPLKPLSVYCENTKTKKQISGERVLNVKISSHASWSELEPLSVWAKDAGRHLQLLQAKRKRNDENVNMLADWLVSVKAPRRKNQGRVGVLDEDDILMMNNLEDEMQLEIPAFLTSDRETCEKVCTESNFQTDLLDLDLAGYSWARKHFNLPDPGVLSEMELELAWLAEESLYCLRCPSWDWTFIWMHASPRLRSMLRRDIPVLLIRPDVSQEFHRTRCLIRKALCRGYRRPHMRKVIATHLKFLREQAK